MAQFEISDDFIKPLVFSYIKDLDLVPNEVKQARKISLDEFRKQYCLNHSKTWVRMVIFDRHKDIWYQNGGWVINPSGKEPGIRGTWIKEQAAAEWLDQHDGEIDWHEKLAQ